MNIRFYKDEEERWYADLTEKYLISKEECEMILGADEMLELIAEGKREVTLSLKANVLSNPTLVCFEECSYGGCTYNLQEWKGIPQQSTVWLCDVVLYVFGHFPGNIKITEVHE